ncbi:MAG: apolipoprotein N-acyltransferase [Alphaproteobacteria bacterium]|nr:apolipoprotein N-acyltransferase [Alphaproteobacteria bacterium]
MQYYIPKKKRYLAERIATWLGNLKSHFRNMTLAILGAFISIAFAPTHGVFIVFVSFSMLIWILDGAKTKKRAFADGWWFGIGMFGVGLLWISNALNISGFGWLTLIAPLAFGMILGIFTGFTTLTASIAPKGYQRILLFASMWTLFEWLRSWLFTGFPWNLVGSMWMFDDRAIQITSIIGTYGLSLISILLFCLPSLLNIKPHSMYEELSDAETTDINDTEGNTIKSSLVLSAIVLIICAAVYYYGDFRLSSAKQEFVDGVNLRLVQPNIKQEDKWNPEKYVENFNKYIGMTNSEGVKDITHVIWGETAATYPLDKNERIRKIMTNGLNNNAVLITGFPRYYNINSKPNASASAPSSNKAQAQKQPQTKEQTKTQAQPYKAWNSMMAMDANGNILSVYDKAHLVPFGEYIPFRNIVGESINKITHGMKDFSKGEGIRTLNIKGLPPAGALICYEVIFPSQVTAKENRPSLLINITNDGWYGKTQGPYEHFAAARLRAVEEGIPVVRVANTGISGVIDAFGRTVSKTKLSEEAVLDEKLPKAIPTTLYGRFGNIIPLLLVLLLTGLALIKKPETND